MDGATREKREGSAAQALAQIVYSPQSLEHVDRAFEFLALQNPHAAAQAVMAIREAIGLLKNHPLLGRRVSGEVRELVISFGSTGYVALYRYLQAQDEVRVLAIRHQRELDYPD